MTINWSKVFPSKYLKADLLPAERTVVTISSVGEEEVGQDRQLKAVVRFAELEQGLILNRTNFGALCKGFGPDDDRWVGKKIELRKTQERVRGEIMNCIRLAPAVAIAGREKEVA